jgi:hypothetical protein
VTAKIMPLARQYKTALKNPEGCFTDPDLQASSPRTDVIGQPHAISGQFALVFQMKHPSGKQYAVKCFLHDIPNQRRRYQRIHDALEQYRATWTTDFVYEEHGITVEGEQYPMLRMRWVEGVTLLAWLRQHYGDTTAVKQLYGRFVMLAKELSDAKIAHGDLQHGNIMVEPGGTLRLVDYDGMYLPGVGLEKIPPTEFGLPAYQPPSRTVRDYGPTMDRFSAWIIALSLRALAADPNLWEQCNGGLDDYLLLDADDFRDPDTSQRLAILEAHAKPQVRELAQRTKELLSKPLAAMPVFTPTGLKTAASKVVPVPEWYEPFIRARSPDKLAWPVSPKANSSTARKSPKTSSSSPASSVASKATIKTGTASPSKAGNLPKKQASQPSGVATFVDEALVLLGAAIVGAVIFGLIELFMHVF